MAALTMENPLSPTPEMIRQKNIDDLIGCVADLSESFKSHNVPLDDDNQHVHRFCAKLEHLLQYGLKVKSSLLGGKKDYWNYFCDCLSSTKGLNDGIKFVKAQSDLKTNQGRGRAFLRFALVHHRLADTIQQCCYNHKVTSDWYTSKAVWVNPKLCAALINAIYDLNEVTFDLAIRGYDLDTSWPSFARKNLEPQSWNVPSRSVSITSINSSSVLQDTSSYQAPPSINESVIENLKSELNESENERIRLQFTMEQEQASSGESIEQLKQENEKLKEAVTEMQVRYGKLETELELKETDWAEKEVAYMSGLDESADIIHQLNEKFTILNKQVQDKMMSKSFEKTEADGQLVLRDKQIQALRLELKASELELKSLRRLEEQKQKLMSLMEQKIVSLKKKNATLSSGADGGSQAAEKATGEGTEKTAKDGERIEAGACSAEEKAALEEKLHDTERINKELRDNNREFKKMLSEIEDKGSKISKLAKEKLYKYSDENKALKSEMSSMQDENNHLKQQLQDSKTGSVQQPDDAPAVSGSSGEDGAATGSQPVHTQTSVSDHTESKSTGCGNQNVDLADHSQQTTQLPSSDKAVQQGAPAPTVDAASVQTVGEAEGMTADSNTTPPAADSTAATPTTLSTSAMAADGSPASQDELLSQLAALREEKQRLETELEGAKVVIQTKEMSLGTLQDSIATLTEKFQILDRNSHANREELLQILKQNYHLRQDLESTRSSNFKLAAQKSQYDQYLLTLREELNKRPLQSTDAHTQPEQSKSAAQGESSTSDAAGAAGAAAPSSDTPNPAV